MHDGLLPLLCGSVNQAQAHFRRGRNGVSSKRGDKKAYGLENKNKKATTPAVGINAADRSRDFGTSRWRLFGHATSEACLAEAR